MKIIKNSEKLISSIKQIISNTTFDSISDLELNENFYALIIYNTDDLFLRKDQFDALKAIASSEEKFYVMQLERNCITDIGADIYEFEEFPSYEQYTTLNLWSVTICAEEISFIQAQKYNSAMVLWAQICNCGGIFEDLAKEWFLPSYMGIITGEE